MKPKLSLTKPIESPHQAQAAEAAQQQHQQPTERHVAPTPSNAYAERLQTNRVVLATHQIGHDSTLRSLYEHYDRKTRPDVNENFVSPI